MTMNRIRGLRLDKSRLTINGRPLGDLAVFAMAGGISIGEAEPVTMHQAIPGRSGGWDMTLDDEHGYPAMNRREITIRVAATGDHMEITEAKALIGSHNGRETTIGGLTELGVYRGRLSVGAWEDTHDTAGVLQWSICTLTLDAEPYAYGPEQRIDLPMDGKPVHALIQGNRPTWPVFHRLVQERANVNMPVKVTHTFTVDGRTIRVDAPLAGAETAEDVHELLVDCENRQTLWRGEPRFIHLDDDYPSLRPGPVTLGGSMPTENVPVIGYTQYMTYTPRWLI